MAVPMGALEQATWTWGKAESQRRKRELNVNEKDDKQHPAQDTRDKITFHQVKPSICNNREEHQKKYDLL